MKKTGDNMNILYTSCFPEKVFFDVVKSGRLYSHAAQKFNSLFVKGFCLNGCNADVILHSDFAIDSEALQETVDQCKVNYKHLQAQGNVLKRFLKKNLFVNRVVSQFAKKNPDGAVVVDALNTLAYSVTKAAKKHGIKIVTVVTDFPNDLIAENEKLGLKKRLHAKMFYGQFNYTDLFVLLTENMKERIRRKGIRYLVMNGICDSALLQEERQTYKKDKTVLLYSGGISRKFGAENLIQAFKNIKDDNIELHFYGYLTEEDPGLAELMESDSRIKFFGSVPNSVILEKQQQASFLINPRLVNGYEYYTKYSFPSKNIEYMVSGTPMITTKLPCVTQEYSDFVYFFENDSVEGMEETLRYCLALPEADRAEKGKRAKQFVLNTMNNVIQCKKILSELGEI